MAISSMKCAWKFEEKFLFSMITLAALNLLITSMTLNLELLRQIDHDNNMNDNINGNGNVNGYDNSHEHININENPAKRPNDPKRQQQQQQLSDHNNICFMRDTVCRYDDVGDFLEATTTATAAAATTTTTRAIIHEPLPSIPSSRRIPHAKANDWNYILERRATLPEDGSETALMDYNAILIPLYKNKKKSKNGDANDELENDDELEPELDQEVLDRITGAYHPYFTTEDVRRVKYLYISRSSNLHSCKPKFKFHYGTLANDFLGLSLLDDQLRRIDGSDVAINVDKWLLGNMTAIFHDFQIIPARTRNKTNSNTNSTTNTNSNTDKTIENTKKDQLFIFPSGHIGTFGMPIDIRRVPPRAEYTSFATADIPWNTPMKGQNYKSVPFSHEYMYGHGLEVRFLIDTQWIRENRQPHGRGDALFNRGTGIDRGKNFHFFESRAGDMYMEMWPHGSHRTVPVNFIADDAKGTNDNDNDNNNTPQVVMFPNKYMDYLFKHKQRGRKDVIHPNVIEAPSGKNEPKPSFKNKVPKHERPYKRFRGTSQIIDFVLQGKDVKLGISHTVAEEQVNITDKRAYLSQFYAFDPNPPFQIVAISGHFCFNHMSEHDVGYDAQWVSERPLSNRTAPIMILRDSYRCPIITFAAGLSEMIGFNDKNVIITYGVNDCYSRSLIVPKKKVEMLLLGRSE